jgi:hypothetical protein
MIVNPKQLESSLWTGMPLPVTQALLNQLWGFRADRSSTFSCYDMAWDCPIREGSCNNRYNKQSRNVVCRLHARDAKWIRTNSSKKEVPFTLVMDETVGQDKQTKCDHTNNSVVDVVTDIVKFQNFRGTHVTQVIWRRPEGLLLYKPYGAWHYGGPCTLVDWWRKQGSTTSNNSGSSRCQRRLLEVWKTKVTICFSLFFGLMIQSLSLVETAHPNWGDHA